MKCHFCDAPIVLILKLMTPLFIRINETSSIYDVLLSKGLITCSKSFCGLFSISGTGGIRTNSCPGEWPVSYHGTKHQNTSGIAKQGYLLSKGQRQMYGEGIYSTPNIEVAAGYAQPFNHNGTTYRVVFQNRVSTTDLCIIDAEETRVGEYWVQPHQELIRAYGLCIQEG